MIKNLNRTEKIINLIKAKGIESYKVKNNIIKWFKGSEIIEVTPFDKTISARTFVNKIRYRVGTKDLQEISK